MFASIRMYDGVTDVAAVGKGAEAKIFPILKSHEGFVSYNLVSAGTDSVISVSVYDTRDQAEAASNAIREVVQGTLGTLMPNPPKTVVGEVISHLGK
jgi:hypothetical protein